DLWMGEEGGVTGSAGRIGGVLLVANGRIGIEASLHGGPAGGLNRRGGLLDRRAVAQGQALQIAEIQGPALGPRHSRRIVAERVQVGKQLGDGFPALGFVLRRQRRYLNRRHFTAWQQVGWDGQPARFGGLWRRRRLLLRPLVCRFGGLRVARHG